MALIPSINLCLRSNCTELVLTETTGVYSLANLGGYGAPNVTTADVLTLTLVITSPAGTAYTLTSGNLTGFPTSNDDYEFVIPLSLLGNRTKIEDGYWTFVWTATYTPSLSYSYTTAKTFTCSINCCINNMLAQLSLSTCEDCNSLYTYGEYVKTVALRDSLDNATECGDTEYIEDILDILTRLCNKSNCKTCN